MVDAIENPGRPGPKRQRQVYLEGLAGRIPAVSANALKLEQRAEEAMSREAFAYIAGGAGLETTMDANRAAFDRWRIVPRQLRNVLRRDARLTLFDLDLPAPFLLAPIGVLEMAHPQADRAVARAAAAAGLPMIFSNQASVPMEDCAAVMGDSPRWFQLYWNTSNAVVKSLVRRAEDCGCSAIVLTLDTTLLGWRPRDLDLGYLPFLEGKGIAQYTSDPAFMALLDEVAEADDAAAPGVNLRVLAAALGQARRHPGPTLKALSSGRARQAVQRFVATYSRPSLSWDDLGFLRDATRLPILLKGILHPEDARLAIEHGMDGIIVSNHGGRQVDGGIGALEALPEVVGAVAGRIPVLFDSGIRGGADAFKALALGARAVCIGRPYCYGLAIDGEAGVRSVLDNFIADFDLTLGLAGCHGLDDIQPGTLQTAG